MKLHTTSLSILAALCCCLVFACGQPKPEESDLTGDLANLVPSTPEIPALADVAANQLTPVFANDYAVASIVSVPGEFTIPEHGAGSRICYALTDVELKIMRSGQEQLVELAAGEAEEWAAGKYSIVNPGTEQNRFLLVSRSETPFPEGMIDPELADPVPEIQEYATILANTTLFIAYDIEIGAGETLDISNGLPLLMYAHQDFEILLPDLEGTAGTIAVASTTGEWQEPGEYTLRSASEEDQALVTVVAFKQ